MCSSPFSTNRCKRLLLPNAYLNCAKVRTWAASVSATSLEAQVSSAQDVLATCDPNLFGDKVNARQTAIQSAANIIILSADSALPPSGVARGQLQCQQEKRLALGDHILIELEGSLPRCQSRIAKTQQSDLVCAPSYRGVPQRLLEWLST
jgi:hypothetical protein